MSTRQKKLPQSKDQEIKIIYGFVSDPQEDIERNIEAAFDVLFDAVWNSYQLAEKVNEKSSIESE
jgi:hypothetical protein